MTPVRWTFPVPTGYLYRLRIVYAYHDLGAWA